MAMNDPQTITAVSAFSDPVLAPSDATIADSRVVSEPAQQLANRDQWLRDRLASALPESGGAADEYLYPTPKTRTFYIGPSGGMSSVKYLDAAGDSQFTTALGRWEPDTLIVSGPPDQISEGGIIRCTVERLGYLKDISHELRTGMGLTGFGARITPGVAEATSAERMLVSFFRRTIAGGALTSMGTVTSDATNTVQPVSVPAFTHTVDRNVYTYHALCRSSLNAPSTKDLLHAFFITFTDPGPRNY